MHDTAEQRFPYGDLSLPVAVFYGIISHSLKSDRLQGEAPCLK
jgi:hypothetical protein